MQKKFATQIEGQTKKEKRRRRTFNGSIFSETKRLLSRNSLFKKNHHPSVFTHNTRAHTHTLLSLSLSLCKLSEHCCCCCCCCCELSGVFSSSLSLFLIRKKKKGEEKRKTTEDHPKTVVERGGSNPTERDQNFYNTYTNLSPRRRERRLFARVKERIYAPTHSSLFVVRPFGTTLKAIQLRKKG